MSLLEKLLGGLILLTFVVVVLRHSSDSERVLTGLAKFNTDTFGPFLRA